MVLDKLNVLYVNHKKQKCGVYEFGREIGSLLTTSDKYNIHYCECDTLDEFRQVYKQESPKIVIYNYHPATMPWVKKKSEIFCSSKSKVSINSYWHNT